MSDVNQTIKSVFGAFILIKDKCNVYVTETLVEYHLKGLLGHLRVVISQPPTDRDKQIFEGIGTFKMVYHFENPWVIPSVFSSELW